MNSAEVCVVMATYNGSKYIIEQLDSLRLQTLQPNTVCIIDDCSQDNTVEIIQKYISDYNLSSWQLSVHKENKGYISTFWEAIFATNEKYIFLCDQDDIWYTDKIERMYEKMRKHPECLVLYSDFDLIYEKGGIIVVKPKIIGNKLNDVIQIPLLQGVQKFFPGCTYCVNREIINNNFYPKYSFVKEGHDSFLYHIAALQNRLYFFPQITMKWRRHANNTSRRNSSDYNGQCRRKHFIRDEYYRNYKFFLQEVNDDFLTKIQLYRLWKSSEYKLNFYLNPNIILWCKIIPFVSSFIEFKNMIGALKWLSKKRRERAI